jgi:hypothetical protein
MVHRFRVHLTSTISHKLSRSQQSGRSRTWIYGVLFVASLTLMTAAIGFGGTSSGRLVEVHATNTAAVTSSASGSYGGGRLMAADPSGGYWTVNWLGSVTAYDGAPSFGSPVADGLVLTKPVVGMAATPDGAGYWLVASDGGIFTFGDAQFYGSTGAIHLNQPIVGMAATPDGRGYWLVASDGGIFTFGDAGYYGSLGGGGATVLGIVVSPATTGYTLVGADGSASVFLSPPGALSEPTGGASDDTTEPTVITQAPGAAALAADCQPSSTPSVVPNSALSNEFAQQAGPGWVAGDSAYSTKLPDGNEAFVFSDSLIGMASATGKASLTGFVHNSEMVGTSSALTSDYGGTYSAPQTLIPDTNDSGDQWQVGATYMENGSQLVYVNEFAPVAGSDYGQFTGRAGIAVFSLTSDGLPKFEDVQPLPTDATTQWGTSAMQSGSYDYIYGADFDGAKNVFYGTKVARAPLGSSLNTSGWQYWNGSQWIGGESNAVPITTITVPTGVTPQPDHTGFEAVSIPEWQGSDTSVDLSYSCSPQGPWTSPAPVYTIPEVTQYPDEVAYIPTFHPEISSTGNLVVSYSVNTLENLPALEQNVHLYQPRFIDISAATAGP